MNNHHQSFSLPSNRKTSKMTRPEDVQDDAAILDIRKHLAHGYHMGLQEESRELVRTYTPAIVYQSALPHPTPRGRPRWGAL